MAEISFHTLLSWNNTQMSVVWLVWLVNSQ